MRPSGVSLSFLFKKYKEFFLVKISTLEVVLCCGNEQFIQGHPRVIYLFLYLFFTFYYQF